MPWLAEQGVESYALSLRGTSGTEVTEEMAKRGSVLMSDHVGHHLNR